MAMSTKLLYSKTENRRSSLRSGSKRPLQLNEPVVSVSENKVVEQIHIEIEHQQTNNATKSTFSIHEDVKICHQQLLHQDFPSRCTRNNKLLKNQSITSDNNIFSLRPAQISHNSMENSIQQKMNTPQELQKQELKMQTPPAKSHLRYLKKTESSLYHEERKSYRKIKKNDITLVPHRKCQDPFQHKIVVLINKICQNKHNDKEIENLTEKIQKISHKDFCNPYVVSGIQTILNLFQKTPQVNVTSLAKLKSEVKNLSSKILMQLGKIDSYENSYYQHIEVDVDTVKPKMIRKIYKLLMQQNKLSVNEAKQKSVGACEAFFSECKNKVTEDEMISFLKQSRFLQC